MRITLIRPRTGNTPEPPLGLLILSACCKQAGHEIQVLDPGPEDTSTIEKLKQFHPDAIGFSLLTTQVSRGLLIQEQIKKAMPEILTFAGGIHPSALPEWTLRNFRFDFVVIGEGEITLIHALDVISKKGNLADAPGVAFLDEGIFIRTPRRSLIQNLDTIPFPDREAISFEKYLRPPGNIRGKYLRRATSIITSRGCPFGCIFCSSHDLFGRTVRRRSIGNVLQEIELLKSRHRIDGLWFLDDTLLEDHLWLTELCRGLKSIGLPWSCQAHVRRADESMFRLMRESGCLQLEFGVESGSERVLQRLRKGSDPEEVRHAFALCRKLGLRTLANFMIGIPDETEADARASLALARDIKPDHVVITFATPLPGSQLFEEALEKGWIPENPDFSQDWVIRQTERPAVTMTMPAEVMMRIRKEFDNLFFWKNIRGYFLYPRFVLDILLHIAMNPRAYLPGFTRAIRTGRMLHIVETIWEVYNRI